MADSVQEASNSVISRDPLPVLGGETAVTLTSAPALESLGISVVPTGAAAIDTSGSDPTALFPITGGTDAGDAGAVILHQQSGLTLADDDGSISLSDFRIDTGTLQVEADVSVNGQAAGTVPVFDIGTDSISLTLTPQAATAVNEALGTMAITPDIVIGTAAPRFISDPLLLQHPPLSFITAADAQPITGGQTDVTLSSAEALGSVGVTVTPLGSASVQSDGADPVATFPVTGGTEEAGGTAIILHQGSGLTLSDDSGSISLCDFLIDTRDGTVAAVTINGQEQGRLAVFDIGSDGSSLTLTSTATGAANQALGTMAITSDIVIGSAAPSPSVLQDWGYGG